MSNVVLLDFYRARKEMHQYLDNLRRPGPGAFLRTPCCGTDPLAIHYDPLELTVRCEICGVEWRPVG